MTMKKTSPIQKSAENSDRAPQGQFALLKKRRFAPFFWTQCCGALNDNLFKTALAILVAYQVSAMGAAHSHLMVNLAAALFILPFFLFSALAGQLADKYEKAGLIRRVKAAEIVIMAGAAVAFICHNTGLLMGLLFAMGAQSTFFGPVKYSLLPQHLKSAEIVGGNGLVEMGTFVAILLGTMAGGTLVAAPSGPWCVAVALLLIALAGWLASRRIPAAPAADPGLSIRWNLASETWRVMRLARQKRSVWLSMLGISWFWFLGSAYVTQLPNFVREVLNGQPQVVTLLLAFFSVGVGAGSLWCERLSGRYVELGLVSLGGVGMTLFGLDLAHVSYAPVPTHLLKMGQFLGAAGSWRLLMDLGLIGLCGGLYIVPLFAFLQTRTPAAIRSRLIAANNVLNALFMVASALFAAVVLVVFNWSLQKYFMLLAVLNLAVALYICRVTPLSVLRLTVWALTRLMYRVRCHGLERIPGDGAAVLVCNHVSYVDALIIAGSCRRPVRFVMHADYYRLPGMCWLFRLAGVIPIASARANPNALRQALECIAATLEAGELVCLFPEGRLTRSGEIDAFRPGIERIIQRNPVPVVPLALRGLWGSMFSHKGGPALRHWPRRIWARIELTAGDAVQPQYVTARNLQRRVQYLHGSLA
jgi:1-acyl-sn-glycerol-3-phosphate acyltransferase